MTLQEVKEILDAEIVVGEDQLDLEVKEAGCADLMSDVLFFGKSGMLLLTGLTNPNIIHTAYALGVAAVVMVRGKLPPPETIRLAEEFHIPLFLTKYILFETAGRLYMHGMVGNIKKVGEKK